MVDSCISRIAASGAGVHSNSHLPTQMPVSDFRECLSCEKEWHDSTSAETICWGSRLQCAGSAARSWNWGRATTLSG
jgi:hypothetical protein